MTFYSPIKGTVSPLSTAPDPVFAEKMLGDGIIVAPLQIDKKIIVLSPMDGVIKTLNKSKHAVVIEGAGGMELLVHVGVDTVALKGKGFKSLIKEGQRVTRGAKLLKVDLEFVRANAPSDVIVILVTNRPENAIDSPAAGLVEAGDAIFSMSDIVSTSETPAPASTGPVDLKTGDWSTIPNPNGLHARPAAVLAKMAQGFADPVYIEKKDVGRVNAKSSTAIMGLVLEHGNMARFVAAEAAAVAALDKALASGLGETIATAPSVIGKVTVDEEVVVHTRGSVASAPKKLSFDKETRIPVSQAGPGLAVGTIFRLSSGERLVERKAVVPTGEEKKKLGDALTEAVKAIGEEMKQSDKETKDILDAHIAFLSDPDLVGKAEALVTDGLTAAFAWQSVTKDSAALLAKSGNPYLEARAADLRDVSIRVIDLLLGGREEVVFPENSIVLVHELLPSDAARLTAAVAGVIMVNGSPTGHASIMLRNRGIPSVFGAPIEALNYPVGADVIIDADENVVIFLPNKDTLASFLSRKERMDVLSKEAMANRMNDCVTTDGRRIEVAGNVSSKKEAVAATDLGAEGYGLARSEFLFYERKSAPGEDEQKELYQALLDATKHDVVVRLLDAGADKPLAFIEMEKEENPQLGVRGIRMLTRHEDLLRTQLRALLRCKPASRMKIMIPMIALVEEVEFTKKVMEEEMKKLGVSKADAPRLGIMAETPAVCVMSEQFARHVDFFSVGSNDLFQYTMAVDRTSSSLASFSGPLTPAILNMIRLLCAGAMKHDVPVAVCGASASDIYAALMFVGLGVTELAVSGASIPQIKEVIRHFSYEKLQEVASKAITLSSDIEVKELIKTELDI